MSVYDGWLPGFEPPLIPPETSACADCGIDTIYTIDEWYMVNDDLWEQAWIGRHKSWHVGHGNFLPSQEILCIGCLEKRIGRTLIASDFTDAPINELHKCKSERMRERLTARHSSVVGDPFDSRRVLPST